MATQKVDISKLLSETQEVKKSHFRHYLTLNLLFILPFSFCIVAYPTLQHSLATPQSKSYLLFPFSGDPIVFKPISLFFTLLCLPICAIGTVSYSVYHGHFGKPVEFIYAVKSLPNSFMRIFATFFCAHTIILAGLVVIGLMVIGVHSGIGYLGFEIRYGSAHCLRAFYVLGWVLFSLGWLYFYVDGVLAPVIVVVESSWGIEPLRQSAYLVKGNRGVVVRLFVFDCAMTCLTVLLGGALSQITPFGWNLYESIVLIATMASCTYILSTHLLHNLITITILYMKCKALQGEVPEEMNRKYTSLPLDEEKVPHVV